MNSRSKNDESSHGPETWNGVDDNDECEDGNPRPDPEKNHSQRPKEEEDEG